LAKKRNRLNYLKKTQYSPVWKQYRGQTYSTPIYKREISFAGDYQARSGRRHRRKNSIMPKLFYLAAVTDYIREAATLQLRLTPKTVDMESNSSWSEYHCVRSLSPRKQQMLCATLKVHLSEKFFRKQYS